MRHELIVIGIIREKHRVPLLIRNSHKALISSLIRITRDTCNRELLIKSAMNRVADKNGMIARRATQVAAATRY